MIYRQKNGDMMGYNISGILKVGHVPWQTVRLSEGGGVELHPKSWEIEISALNSLQPAELLTYV